MFMGVIGILFMILFGIGFIYIVVDQYNVESSVETYCITNGYDNYNREGIVFVCVKNNDQGMLEKKLVPEWVYD